MSDDDRELLGRLTAVMSLLEGHADVMMDAVGPDVIPTVDVLRAADVGATGEPARPPRPLSAGSWAWRRSWRSTETAPPSSGPSSMTSAWPASTRSGSQPDHLPTRDELHAPEQWIARVATSS